MKAKWTSDREAILAHILANPDDDAPRLVMSDWLEENGQADRADFIRLQIEAENSPKCDHAEMFRNINGCRRCDLKAKIAQCLRDSDSHFFGIIPDDWYPSNVFHPIHWEPRSGINKTIVWPKITRGFVSDLICPFDTWMTSGPTIVRQHPIQKIQLTDKYPLYSQKDCCYLLTVSPVRYKNLVYATQSELTRSRESNRLPAEFADPDRSVLEFPAAEIARQWLSDQAIKWAKSSQPSNNEE